MLYNFLKPIARFIFGILFRIKVKNPENIPEDRSVILCANHISLLDCVFIAGFIKPKVGFLGKSELNKLGPITWFLKAIGYIPITRGKADVGAVKNVIDTLHSGKSVLVFIQGTRKRGVPIESTAAKNGAALMQKKAECDIVPVSVTNEKMKVRLFSKVYVNIGRPIPHSDLEGMENDQITKKIFQEIVSLSKEEK